MLGHIIAMLVILLLMAALITLQSQRVEPFADSASSMDGDCPTSAERTEDGKILVQPGSLIFDTMADYTNYLSGLYAKGKMCIPPQVKSNKNPIDGILGGLGVGKETGEDIAKQGITRQVLATDFTNEKAAAGSPINKLDDYEYSRVFELESQSRNKADKEQKSDLLRKRAVDWSILPFNSEARAKEEEAFVSDRMDSAHREPKTGVLFQHISAGNGGSIEPPDVEAARLREQQVLASYRPTDVSKHIVDNETEAVAKLVMDQYSGDPDWEPVVRKVGDNQWEVTELRPKAKRERFDDAVTTDRALSGNETLDLPTPTIDIHDRMTTDPYFDTSREGKALNYNDYRKWTPGLERMFAPTDDKKAWY